MKRRILPAILAGVLLLLPLHSVAAEHTYSESEKKAVISVGQVEVTPEELTQSDHLVPVIVRMYPNPGFNVLEFGISSELSFEILEPDDLDPDTERGAMLCSLPTAPAKMKLSISMTSNICDYGDKHYAWLVCGTSRTKTVETIAILLMRVPETAQPGDSFDITFLDRGISANGELNGPPAICNHLDEDGQFLEYRKLGEFVGFSGSITITEPETTEPSTEPQTTVPAVEPPASEPPLLCTLGDVNGNGSINAKDASLVLQAAARIGAGKSHGLTPAQSAAADTNRDGAVSAQDAAQILRYAAKVGAGFKGSMEDYLGY